MTYWIFLLELQSMMEIPWPVTFLALAKDSNQTFFRSYSRRQNCRSSRKRDNQQKSLSRCNASSYIYCTESHSSHHDLNELEWLILKSLIVTHQSSESQTKMQLFQTFHSCCSLRFLSPRVCWIKNPKTLKHYNLTLELQYFQSVFHCCDLETDGRRFIRFKSTDK